jgi:hypothetical protein
MEGSFRSCADVRGKCVHRFLALIGALRRGRYKVKRAAALVTL